MANFKEIILFCVVVTLSCYAENVQDTVEAPFHRTCNSSYDCNFENAKSTVFLSCYDGNCLCQNLPYPVLDVAHYPVRISQGKCFVSYNAPCGTSNGLTLFCESGKECIEDRCRTPSNLRSRPLGYLCDEDIDCQNGLKCLFQEHSFPLVSRCEEVGKGSTIIRRH